MHRMFSTYDWGTNGGKPDIKKGTVKRIVRYFFPYWRWIALVVVCIILASLFGLLQPLIIRRIIDVAIPDKRIDLLDLLILAMLGAAIGGSLIGVAQTYFNTLIGQRVMFDIRNGMYRHLHRMSIGFFTNTKTGDIMSRVNNDVGGLQAVVTDTLSSSLSNAVIAISTIITMYMLDWRLATLSILILPLFIIPTRRVGRLNFQVRKDTQQKIGELSSIMQETLSVSGAMLVKAFMRQKYEADRFQSTNGHLMKLQIRQAMLGRWFFMFIGIVSTAGPAIIYWFGGRAVIGNDLSLGTVIAFTAFLQRLYGPVASLTNTQVNVLGSVALFERLFEYLDMPVEIQNRPSAKDITHVQGKIEFEHVSFQYRDDHPILQDVDFTIQPGQLVALVGPSGSGKTTLSNLIPRFYDPSKGRILIDGKDIRDVTLESLGSVIGLVTQETYLFHNTIRENLVYGRQNATEDELIAATKAAYAHDFIMSLPDGYDTIVGERGHKLSGGEKQRIAIARVILKDPKILILDEATSALDTQSEALVQAALEKLMESRTSVVIAHRLSTILNADTIMVLHEGRVVESGTHEELLSGNGLYAELYHRQLTAKSSD